MLDVLYAQAAGARRRWYEQHPEARRWLQQPVISVGNLSVGGTGKTPLVARLAEWLIGRGERPSILSRGYKRTTSVDGVVVVSDGAGRVAGIDVSGDEPSMLARQLPTAVVCVSEQRYLAGVLAERQLGATVHVLDDGFQHVQLGRAMDILVTRPHEIPNGRVLPFGRLREARAAAARADFVVVLDADADTARAEAWELGISQFACARRVLINRNSEWPLQNVFAVAGIASPQQFFDALREVGFTVAGVKAFPDHHRYTEKDVQRIAAEARAAGADTVVTTEKDSVRFGEVSELPFSLRPVAMTLDVDHWDALTNSCEQAIQRARGLV